MYRIYSHNCDSTIIIYASFETRYKCVKFLKDMSSCGRMIHFYFISKLPLDKAIKRYSR